MQSVPYTGHLNWKRRSGFNLNFPTPKYLLRIPLSEEDIGVIVVFEAHQLKAKLKYDYNY